MSHSSVQGARTSTYEFGDGDRDITVQPIMTANMPFVKIELVLRIWEDFVTLWRLEIPGPVITPLEMNHSLHFTKCFEHINLQNAPA